eukprot:8944326-Alexandrium_andersonii.AAC.1
MVWNQGRPAVCACGLDSGGSHGLAPDWRMGPPPSNAGDAGHVGRCGPGGTTGRPPSGGTPDNVCGSRPGTAAGPGGDPLANPSATARGRTSAI